MNSVGVEVGAIPFSQAVLCLDCDRVTASKSRCEVCGSSALMNLAVVLNNSKIDPPYTKNQALAKSLLQSYYDRKNEQKQQTSVEADELESNSVSCGSEKEKASHPRVRAIFSAIISKAKGLLS